MSSCCNRPLTLIDQDTEDCLQDSDSKDLGEIGISTFGLGKTSFPSLFQHFWKDQDQFIFLHMFAIVWVIEHTLSKSSDVFW